MPPLLSAPVPETMELISNDMGLIHETYFRGNSDDGDDGYDEDCFDCEVDVDDGYDGDSKGHGAYF